ncbi:MAG: hypothetical protein AAGH19_08125, partial [Pseudomonadota bacterium]
ARGTAWFMIVIVDEVVPPDPDLDDNIAITNVPVPIVEPDEDSQPCDEIIGGAPSLFNPGINDAWFNPETAGQGFFFNVFPDAGVFFLSWFTFDTEAPDASVQAMLGAPGQRWLTAAGTWSGNTAELTVTNSSGGVFDSASPPVNQDEGYGTLVVTMIDCGNAEIRYEFPDLGLSGTVPLRRVVRENEALCEALTEGN